MARYATALKLVDFAEGLTLPPEVPHAEPDASVADAAPQERSVWLFRGLFGVNISLWLGIVVAIRYMV